jgi:hypothetical protein
MSGKPLATTDMRLEFWNLFWGGEFQEGFPVLFWPGSETVCEPATLYFGYSVTERYGVDNPSLVDEAYIIREFLIFLLNEGLEVEQVTDRILRIYRESQRPLLDAKQISRTRIARKLSVIYTFYRCLDIACPMAPDGELRRKLVAPTEIERAYAITTRLHTDKRGRHSYRWSNAKRVGETSTRRATPDVFDVAKINTWVRSRPERILERNPSAKLGYQSYVVADRDWVLVRFESEAGFRRSEVRTVTLQQLWDILSDEGLKLPGCAQDLAAPTDAMKQSIIDFLDKLEARRNYLYIKTLGKGRVTRFAVILIGLFRDILEVWLWGGRAKLIQDWTRRDLSYESDVVFLSTETRKMLKPGSIGDIALDAFKGLGIRGSGQRLRGHYSSMLAAVLWEEEMVRNGFQFSQAVYNTTLDRLADAMGHSKASTTVKYYLDRTVQRYYNFKNKGKFHVFMSVFKELSSSYNRLLEVDIKTIVSLVGALANAPDNKLREVVQKALAHPSLNPPLPAKSLASNHPKLKVVDPN